VPENVLLVGTASRLVGLLAKLEKHGVTTKDAKEGWAVGFRSCADQIRHALASTVLCHVSEAPIEAFHEQAALRAHHPAYGLALRIHEAMKGIDTKDEATIARLIAEGALIPFKDDTRFEIAVLIRLGRFIERATGCTAKRGLIEEERKHIFEFSAGNTMLRIHYNQTLFANRGPRDLGLQHYFGEQHRLRPDITIELLHKEKRMRSVIIEIKHSSKREYLKSGYEQALLYRTEYAHALSGWPKVILVVSCEETIQGLPRCEDDVIAVSWKTWVPEMVLSGLLEGFGADHH
jgi:hypothetical protein